MKRIFRAVERAPRDLLIGFERAAVVVARFWPFLRTRRAGLLLAFVLLLLETGASLAGPWPLALVLDYVLGEKTLPAFLPGVVSNKGFLLAGIALLLVLVSASTRGVSAYRSYLLGR